LTWAPAGQTHPLPVPSFPVIRDQHHNWLKEIQWMRLLVATKRVRDHTDRGVHVRKCEGVPLVGEALKKLQRDVYPLLGREDSIKVDHLLQEARGRIREGCPPGQNRAKPPRAYGEAVERTLLELYAQKGTKHSHPQRNKRWLLG